jgi:hypothetical protein
MKNGVFWDVTPCGSCKNRSFGRTYRLHDLSDKNRWTKNNVVFLHRARGLLVTASIVPSSPILVNLMKEALSSSEIWVLTRATRCNILEVHIVRSPISVVMPSNHVRYFDGKIWAFVKKETWFSTSRIQRSAFSFAVSNSSPPCKLSLAHSSNSLSKFSFEISPRPFRFLRNSVFSRSP